MLHTAQITQPNRLPAFIPVILTTMPCLRRAAVIAWPSAMRTSGAAALRHSSSLYLHRHAIPNATAIIYSAARNFSSSASHSRRSVMGVTMRYTTLPSGRAKTPCLLSSATTRAAALEP